MSEQQAEQARAMGEKWAGISSKIAAAVAPVFAGFVTPFFWGLIVWLVGAKVLKGNFPYMKAVEVVGLANMVSVLEVIVKTLLIVGLGNLYAAPSLVLLVKEFDPQNTVHSLLALVNVMTFWLLAVRAIGLGPAQRRVVRQGRPVGLWHLGGLHRLLRRPGSLGAGRVQADGRMRPPATDRRAPRPAPASGVCRETKPFQPCLNN